MTRVKTHDYTVCRNQDIYCLNHREFFNLGALHCSSDSLCTCRSMHNYYVFQLGAPPIFPQLGSLQSSFHQAASYQVRMQRPGVGLSAPRSASSVRAIFYRARYITKVDRVSHSMDQMVCKMFLGDIKTQIKNITKFILNFEFSKLKT